ncbi:MAG: hypothetical protein ABJ327_10215 [Litoreibacter sp.]
MRPYLWAGITALCILPSIGLAQDNTDPLSAIDWLSDVIRAPQAPIVAPEVSVVEDASPSQIVTTPLGQVKLDAVGLLPPSVTGVPASFWGNSSTSELQALILSQRTDLLPPLSAFLKRLMLAELTPPPDSNANGGLFLARVDKLLDMGALEEARALVERAGPNTPELFRRWFDVNLLTGLEDQACRVMLAKPEIAPTYPARIFCLARGGDWPAAALTLNTAQLLGLINSEEDALMARFLDPDLFEGEPPLPTPERLTPLAFKMHSAIGEPLSLSTLPNAFAFAALAPTEGWKQRITASERLTRSGAVTPTQLMAAYKERSPAASGGVWDRAEAIQAFDAAILAKDVQKVSALLSKTIRPMRRAGLEAAFASVYGERLARIPLTGDAQREGIRIELLSESYEAVAKSKRLPEDTPKLWIEVATGNVTPDLPNDQIQAAIVRAFTNQSSPSEFDALFADKKFGEIALKALILLQDGTDAAPADIEVGLQLLSKLGLQDIARRTALHILIMRPHA